MNTLEVTQMENVQGGVNAISCGIGVGILIGTGGLLGLAVAAALCLSGDTPQ